MTLIILDPNLDRETGHHIEWDLTIARAAMERGEKVVIYGHRDCKVGERDKVQIVPWFSETCYASRFPDPITGRFDDFRYFNDTLAGELSRLPRELFRASDAVLVPTLTDLHLLGYVAWMKTFDPARAPLFVVHLMFPSGLGFAEQFDGTAIADPFQALFYRLAYRRASEPGASIHFFGGGRQLAREYSALFDAKVEAHPVPNCPRRQAPLGKKRRPGCLLFAGDAKADKGFLLVPGLAERLSTEHPGWDVLIHANAGASWGEALVAYEAVVRLAKKRGNIKLATGRLTREEYLALMEAADGMIFTYDPVIYACKSSGVLWEAVSLEIPVLVAANTWLEREAQEWGAGYMSYADYSVEGIASQFTAFAAQIRTLARKSVSAAGRYHAFNGGAALMDQIGRLWVPRLAAASLVVQPGTRTIPLAELAADGWFHVEQHKGRTARWTAREFDIEFAWPYSSPWGLQVSVAGCIGEDQVLKARVLRDGVELAAVGEVGSDKSGSIAVRGDGPGRESSQVRLRVVLPWTYKPEGETRELGVFVNGLQVEPVAADIGPGATLTAEVISPVTVSPQGDAFLLSDTVSGSALLDPRSSAPVQFEIRTAGGPTTARSVRLFVNGNPISLSFRFRGEDVWTVTGECDAALLTGCGYRSEWDLVAQRSGKAPVWIADLRLGNCRVVPPRAAAASVAVEPEAAPVAEPEAPAMVVVQARSGRAAVDAEDVWLDEIYADDNYRHVDLSMSKLSFAGEGWPHVKLKVCQDTHGSYLEFRNMAEWPDMFVEWPGQERDRFGSLLRIGEHLAAVPLRLPVRRDQLLLQAVAMVLPDAVEAALAHANHDAEMRRFWGGVAQGVAGFLAGKMKAEAAGTVATAA